ncbi:uncharacterized protein LOC112348651 [Selaginella moellendorffii]|uniref:uncharacterized protein LOC112348651 n=1 Tax=Selaginella moellendorffii TaxID=88036 RepID=UPI000D1CD02F|nr:uncharacterized protein LOC112348651 [Selaginella moellendorffii]|eukprot:XP_024537351.1 uncharacterized protein LOC112348651 [Selaginella moellendorffii]
MQRLPPVPLVASLPKLRLSATRSASSRVISMQPLQASRPRSLYMPFPDDGRDLLIKSVAEQCGIEAVHQEDTFESLGCDELDLVEISMALEDCGFCLEGNPIPLLEETVGGACRRMKRL